MTNKSLPLVSLKGKTEDGVNLFLAYNYWYGNLTKQGCCMSHNKTLYQLPFFWAAILIPILLGVSFVLCIVYHDSYFAGPACWTSYCINDAISRLKAPITIMALIFPSVALVASHHRSVQTAAQIKRTDIQIQAMESKNAFENCIKHRELFFKKIEEIEKETELKVGNPQSLYVTIFPDNDFNHFNYYSSTVKADRANQKVRKSYQEYIIGDYDDLPESTKRGMYCSYLIDNSAKSSVDAHLELCQNCYFGNDVGLEEKYNELLHSFFFLSKFLKLRFPNLDLGNIQDFEAAFFINRKPNDNFYELAKNIQIFLCELSYFSSIDSIRRAHCYVGMDELKEHFSVGRDMSD